MTRRNFIIAATTATCVSGEKQVGAKQTSSPYSVEGYIFQQHAQRLNLPLENVIGEVLPMVTAAGFNKVELNSAFFAPALRGPVLSLLRSEQLSMPSVYVGGAMHEVGAADKTISLALETGAVCAPFGCRAIVTNPDPKPGGARKTDADLQIQAASLNRMGRTLSQQGFALRVHHHTPQLLENAREWRHILANTDAEYVHICVDVDWAYEGGFAPVPFLQQAGRRVQEIHVRSARNKLWLEDVEDSDIDYSAVADYLRQQRLAPLIVVELAYRPETAITRSLEEDLRLSRLYTERVFTGVH